MSDRHDPCERCERFPYYEGHTAWCNEISELEARIEKIEKFLIKNSLTFETE